MKRLNSAVKGVLPIHEIFFKRIKLGEKNYEFRKLEKSIASGIYLAVDPTGKKILGLIELEVMGLNNLIGVSTSSKSVDHYFIHAGMEMMIDNKTFEFVKENYVQKGVDYVIYSVKYLGECHD